MCGDQNNGTHLSTCFHSNTGLSEQHSSKSLGWFLDMKRKSILIAGNQAWRYTSQLIIIENQYLQSNNIAEIWNLTCKSTKVELRI